MERNANQGEVFGYEWREIEDLPENWHDLCRDDLRAVHRQWIEDRSLVRDESKVKKFRRNSPCGGQSRQGLSNACTRSIEASRSRSLKLGMEALGKFHARGKISADARALITDQRESLEMVMDVVGGTRDLTPSYIKELHQRLTLSQETCEVENPLGKRFQTRLRKGDWKRAKNNPRRPDGSIHEYCPPERVQDQIEQLLVWHHAHHDTYAEVEAAWLHHRFTQIHPFQDGNGRVARALTGAVFLKASYLVLVIRDLEHRERYLDTLAAADSGDLKPLVDLFADIQIGDLRNAIESFRELRGETVIRAAESLAERARRRKAASQEQAAGVMDSLVQIARIRLSEAKAELERAFHGQGVDVAVQVLSDDDEDRRDWWSWQIVEAARKHGYYADLSRPRRWVSLRLGLPDIEKIETRFVLSLHAVGRAADLHTGTTFLTGPLELGEGSESRRWENDVVSEHPFRFAAETSHPEEIEKRFRDWFESNIETGLSKWGERL